MNSQNAYSAGTLVGASIMTSVIIFIVLYVLLVIAFWKMFNKFGEPGWKAIIPIYNTYIMYKYTWQRKFFWISLILDIVGTALTTAGMGNGTVASMNQPLVWIGLVVLLVDLVIAFIAIYKLSVAFGHGIGYFFGLIFLSIIFYYILGFGSSKYVGSPDTPKASA